jgi:hypothetical protein
MNVEQHIGLYRHVIGYEVGLLAKSYLIYVTQAWMMEYDKL